MINFQTGFCVKIEFVNKENEIAWFENKINEFEEKEGNDDCDIYGYPCEINIENDAVLLYAEGGRCDPDRTAKIIYEFLTECRKGYEICLIKIMVM
jgi:hypothetical protein